ncbi:glycosyltransferase [Microbacterium sp. MAHUQ-60]|uniref:glycosyltransferase n=1 Tax=unclassified Microbacterium TaxID=2609290 RepID=UPI00361A3A2F
MRVVFDILGSTERSGGMRLHSTEMIRAWMQLWPDDEVTIVGPEWAAAEFAAHADVRIWRNESAVFRSLGQLFGSSHAARKSQADALISLSPIVSPFYRGTTVCFQHDWRHKRNPHEFPLVQRIYRRLWEISSRRATFNACISDKAVEETSRYVPGSRNVLVENGWDHARAWPSAEPSARDGHLVTFGHHNNKRPELAIAALASLRKDLHGSMSLVVLGARGAYADELRGLAARLGVDENVVFPGFVSDDDYQRTISTADAVLMPSSDEGFGLPIAEALFLGIPAVVTDDSGMTEIFGDAVSSAAPDAESLAAAVIDALARRAHADPREIGMTTWASAAEKLRSAVEVENSHPRNQVSSIAERYSIPVRPKTMKTK